MVMTLDRQHVESNAAALEAMAGSRAAATVTQHELGALFAAHSGRAKYQLISPYEQVAVVNRCVQILADAIKSMPLMISTADDRIVESGDVIDLINCPYPGLTGEDMVEWITALLPLTGSANLIKGDANGEPMSVSGPVRSLRPAGGDRCAPVYDDRGEVDHYSYSRPGSHRGAIELAPDQVIRWTRSNYQSQRFADGLASLQPAKMAIDQVFHADTANLHNLLQGAAPSMHMKFPQRPEDDKLREYRRFYRETVHGPENAGEPLITWDGVEAEPIEKDFSKMLIDRLKLMSIVDVCVAIGVPPAVLGYVGNSGLGHGKETEEAHEIFWMATVLPMAHWIARRLTIDVLPAFGARSWRGLTRTTRALKTRQERCAGYTVAREHAAGYRIPISRGGKRRLTPTPLFAWFDSSKIGPLITAQLKVVEKGGKLIDVYEQPPADVIEVHDLPYPIHEHQRVATRPVGRVSVTEPDALSDEALGVGEELDADAVPSSDSDTRSVQVPTVITAAPSAEYRAVESELAALWELWVASWDGLRRQAASTISRHWIERRAQVLANVRQEFDRRDARALPSHGRRDLIGRLVFTIVPDGRGSLLAKLGPLIRESSRLGGEQTMGEAAQAQGLETADPFNIQEPGVVRTLQRRGVRINALERDAQRRLSIDIGDALRETIAEGLDSGETKSRIIDTVRERFDLEGKRAATIARTEISAAVEESRDLARPQANVRLKSWLSSRKETGRPHHLQMERITMEHPIAVDENFVLPVTGGVCRHPKASTLDAVDVVNCACMTISRFAGDNLRSVVAVFGRRGFLTIEQLNHRQAA